MTLSTRLCALGLLLGLTFAPAAAKEPKGSDPVAAALALVSTDRAAAAAALEAAIVGQPEDLALRLHAGEQRRLLGEHPAAEAWFKSVLVRAAGGPEVDGARLGLLLLTANSPGVVTAEALAAVPAEGPLDTQNADRYLLLTAEAARADDAAQVRTLTKAALTFARADDEVEARVRASLEALADDGDATVEVAAAKAPPLEQAEAALTAGRLDEARELARQAIATSAPETPDAAAAAALQRRIDTGNVVKSDVIGVLLPLSGKFGAVGQNLKTALEAGCADGGGCRKLVVRDSGESPESAVAAFEDLVLKDGAVAIVGPVRTEDGPAVAAAAEAYRVPLLSMSRAVALAAGRSWVYQATPTVAEQAAGLVTYAMTTKGMKRFAVFAPDNEYGRSATAAFEAEVKARGGSIQASVFYSPDATDLIPFAKQLGRKDYEARKAELGQLQRDAKAAGGDPYKVVLPPVLDYDGLFLPDSAARVPLACAGLAYEEFPVGEFQTTKGGATIPLLGLASWNNKSLATSGGPYVRGSIFIDSWSSGGSTGKAWAAQHAARAGREPSAIEAEAYDVGRALALALKGGSLTRPAVRDALGAAALDPTSTATGASSFAENHVLRRQWQVMTINRSGLAWVATVQ